MTDVSLNGAPTVSSCVTHWDPIYGRNHEHLLDRQHLEPLDGLHEGVAGLLPLLCRDPDGDPLRAGEMGQGGDAEEDRHLAGSRKMEPDLCRGAQGLSLIHI